jgi:glutamate-1-semialdehyde aminotransferase
LTAQPLPSWPVWAIWRVPGLKHIVRDTGVPAQVSGSGSLICIRFTDRHQQNYRNLALTSEETQRRDWFHRFLLNRGILCSPHGLLILSTPMGDSEIAYLLETASDVFTQLAKFESNVLIEANSEICAAILGK